MKWRFLEETYHKNTGDQDTSKREYFFLGQEINRSSTGDEFLYKINKLIS